MFDQNLENQSDLLEAEIARDRTGSNLEQIAIRFGKVQHPNIGFRIGTKYLINGNKEAALPYLIESAKFGLDPSSKWFMTGYADSIGQSIYHLLSQYEYSDEFYPIFEKLFCNAYLLLSNCVMNMGNSAYDSFRTRAMLITNLEKGRVKKVLSKHYYNGNDLCSEILSVGDYYQASLGLRKVGKIDEANKSLYKANENFSTMKLLPQYKPMAAMDISIVAELSGKNQEFFVSNIYNSFKKNEFSVKDDLSSTINKYRKTEKKGFLGSWFN